MSQQPVQYHDLSEYTPAELLWVIRTCLEGCHRMEMYTNYAIFPCKPSVENFENLGLTKTHIIDTCNKSVALYVPPFPHIHILQVALHNYIYRRWFTPYLTNIKCRRFICKMIQPQDVPDDGNTACIVALNSAICKQVNKQIIQYDNDMSPHDSLKVHDLYQIKALFRALLVVVNVKAYNYEDSSAVGRLPVTLVLTGDDAGLSAPISFESLKPVTKTTNDAVQTTLEAAVDFVQALEAREANVFGWQPDPRQAWNVQDRSWWLAEAETRLAADWSAHQPQMPSLIGPSSRFVDMNTYWDWSGDGKDIDVRVMPAYERQAFERTARFWAGRLVDEAKRMS